MDRLKMIEVGKINRLRVAKLVISGAYLEGEDILLPRRDMPKKCNVGDMIDVFVYPDGESLAATTRTPYAMVNTFAWLKVVSVDPNGAFLGFGTGKNLFVPNSEQKQRMETGRHFIVYVYIDPVKNRITASGKIDNFLDKTAPDYKTGQEVDLLVCSQTEIGYKAIINNSHWGILYANEIFQPVAKGERVKGYIKKVREDNKIDLTLQKEGPEKVDDLSEMLLEHLRHHGGFLPLTDKSEAHAIYDMLRVSKKTFKKAVGALYKKRLVVLEDNGIRLVDTGKA